MPAYILLLIDITDPVKYEEYGKAFDFDSFVEDYGGKFVVISDEPEVIEGEWSGRLVIMEFPDREQARDWYDSPGYREVRTIRWASTTTDAALFHGFDLSAVSPVPGSQSGGQT